MNKETRDLVGFRNAKAQDVGFIYSTWLKGLYYGNDYFNQIDQESYFDAYHKVIERTLFKDETEIKICCLKEDEDIVLGYAVLEGNTLHWVHVKKQWRKLGIAKELMPDKVHTITHLTNLAAKIMPKKWRFNPFINQGETYVRSNTKHAS